MKKCPKCGETKPLKTGFYTNRARHSGYQAECKECGKKARNLYRYNNRQYLNQVAKEKRRQIKIDAFLATIDFSQFCPECRGKLRDLADDWIK